MKKTVLLLTLPLLLGSCEATPSSSSFSSSSSSSSSSQELPLGRRIVAKGNVSFSTVIHGTGTNTSYSGKIEGLTIDASASQMPTVLSDLFTPYFYEDLLLDGSLYFERLSYGQVQGKTSQLTTIDKSTILFAMKEGDVYLDFSDIELPSGGSFIRDYLPVKSKLVKPFANAEEYDPNIPLPLTDLPSLLMGAINLDALESYLTVVPFDPDTLKISYQISQESIQALVDLYASEETKVDLDSFMPSLDPSSFSIYFDLTQNRLSRFDVTIGMDFDFAKYISAASEFIDPIHLNFDLEIPITPVENVEPTIEGEYSEVDMERISNLFQQLKKWYEDRNADSSQSSSSQEGNA